MDYILLCNNCVLKLFIKENNILREVFFRNCSLSSANWGSRIRGLGKLIHLLPGLPPLTDLTAAADENLPLACLLDEGE